MAAIGFGVLRPEPNLGVAANEVPTDVFMHSGMINVTLCGDCLGR